MSKLPPTPVAFHTGQADREAEGLWLNLGPQHPAMHGTLHNKVLLDGERIVKMIPEIGYLHTGFEKLFEHLSYNQGVVIIDRANYLSPVCNNVGHALACEELFGLEVPERGQYARTIMCELGRIADHIICVGLAAMDLGAFSVMLWTFIERERLYDVFEAVTGARMTTSWTRVGGVFRELPEDFGSFVRVKSASIAECVAEIEKMLDRNRIWLDRTKGIGVITPEMVREYALTGPCCRSAGVPYDVRRDRPYLVYDRLDWEVVTETDGDVFARYKVRLNEIRQSLKILRQCLEKMPAKGPLSHPDFKVTLPPKERLYGREAPTAGAPRTQDMEALIHHFKLLMERHGLQAPPGEVYSCTEVPNGELGYYIVSDGSGVPYRVRLRPPSFFNYAAFPELCRGHLISDVVAILSSLNIIAGELDR